MGCDIHMFAEKKENEKWVQIRGNFKSTYGDEWGNEVYDGRYYELFSLLANVRNYDCNPPIIPIKEPRGIPDDASHGYLAEVESWGADGHSHSWFTLKELKNIPKQIIEQEVNDESLILKKDENGKIIETCLATSGKHLGKVGKRKLFSLWGHNPLNEIIEKLEKEKYGDDHSIRIVFFFDN